VALDVPTIRPFLNRNRLTMQVAKGRSTSAGAISQANQFTLGLEFIELLESVAFFDVRKASNEA